MNRFHNPHLPSSRSEAEIPIYRDAFRLSFFRLTPYALLLTFLVVLPAFSQQTWERTYGGTGNDWGWSVQQTTDGGYVIAGHSNSFGGGTDDVYLIKTNAFGDTLWTRTYGGGTDWGYSVQQTSDGGFIIVGMTSSFGAGSYDVYLIRANATGDTLWTKTYGGRDYDEGSSVHQTTDGGYIVVGTATSLHPGDLDVYLIKTDAFGDTIWTKTYGRLNDDDGLSVQQTSDSGYIITGWTWSSAPTRYDVYLIKTDASGDSLWTRTYGGTDYNVGNSIQQPSDGGYIIAGYTSSFGSGGYDFYLIRTDAQGDTLWTRTYGGTYDDVGLSVQQTTDDGYIIAGYTRSFGGGGYDVYLVKTNKYGDTLWTRTYGGAGNDEGWAVQQTSDGGYIIAGRTDSFGAGSYDVYLIKTDSLGRSTGVEETAGVRGQGIGIRVMARPNPFISFARIPGHEAERFSLYDVSGRKVGTYKGDRIGEGLGAGVYFVRREGEGGTLARVVKIR